MKFLGLLAVLLILVMSLGMGAQAQASRDCRTSDDCEEGDWCAGGTCATEDIFFNRTEPLYFCGTKRVDLGVSEDFLLKSCAQNCQAHAQRCGQNGRRVTGISRCQIEKRAGSYKFAFGILKCEP